LLDKINEYSIILSDPDELLRVIREELTVIRDTYGDERRTEIVQDHSDLVAEDLIPQEEVVVTLSHGGYAKAQPIDDYQAQKRGGRGRSAAKVKDEDFIDNLFIANTHDTLLCFSSLGKMYWLKVYQVPQASRGSRGKPIVNLLPLSADERISAILPIQEFDDESFVVMVTSGGTIKKTPLSQFSRPRANGIIAIDLRDDRLVNVALTDGQQEILLVASSGKAIRFSENDVRPMGRGAAGVRGIKLSDGHEVIGLSILSGGMILTATENGYGKRTEIDDFPVQGRGGQGVIAIQTTDRNGRTVGALQVSDDDEIMLISSSGTLVRTPVSDISIIGRNTQGVRLIRLESGQRLVGLARIELMGEDEAEAE
ncbi:MAG: DNA gyrase C-terminal beta-propeller domain-containing protein, partial [Woeseia sp.]